MKKQTIYEIVTWIIIFIFMLYFLNYVYSAYAFVSDSLLKVIQGYSLIRNHFASEILFNPARSLDPQFQYYLFQPPMLVKLSDKYLGQYPVFFSFIITPFIYLSLTKYLSYVTSAIFLLFLYILKKAWNLSIWFLLFSFLGTYYVLMSLDVSEHSTLIFLNIVGTTLILKGIEPKKSLQIFGGSLIIGISTWLRLEPILFMFSFFIGILLAYGWNSKETQKIIFIILLGCSLGVLALFLFNFVDYGHPLGPRFFQNYSSEMTPISERFRRFFVLSFWGYYKIGFFTYLPIFLVVILYFTKPSRYKILSPHLKSLFISSLIFIPIVGLLAPNDGVTNIGPRYLSLAIFPMILLTQEFWKNAFSKTDNLKSKSLKYFSVFTMVISLFFTFLGINLYRIATKQLKNYQTSFRSSKADIWIFSNKSLCGAVGLEYFEHKILCVSTAKDMESLLPLLRKQEKNKKVAFFNMSAEALKLLHSNQQNSSIQGEMSNFAMSKEGDSEEIKNILSSNFSYIGNGEKNSIRYDIYLISN
ncbi:MAG: hypothetical protein H7A23_08200 [Leptospiraceae bacterium]|nr:hypothetical protein [Leptospiraceae bacterium]MCP5494526.1 hypothetical protein [Leptospiraceae bacterium]